MTRQPARIALGVGIVTIVIVFIIAYSFYQARNLIAGPEISISSPTAGETVTSPVVTIAGTAKNISFISLNDRQIFVTSQGTFNETLLAAPGYNAWELEARDKFGRIVDKEIEFVFNKT